MIYITLICCLGMSTSMLVDRMQKAAQQAGLEVDIAAMSDSAFNRSERKTDILLLGPQITYLLEEIEKVHGGGGMIIAVIDRVDYGMMNGEKVLKDALALLKEEGQK